MSLWTAGGRLRAAPPFELAKSLEFLCDFGPLRDDTRIEGGALSRAMLVGGRPVGYRVWQPGGEPAVAYELWAEAPLGAAEVAAAEDRIAFFLSLADDLRPLHELAEGDPPFAAVAERLRGYHQVKFPTPFENVCWAILSQRNTATSARAMRAALADRYGGRAPAPGGPLRAFPEAEAVAAAAPGEVAAVVGHSQKGPAVAAAADAFSRVDEGWLRAAPYEDVERWLLGIHGVGPWTATFVLLRGLGRMERLPTGERKLLAAAGQAYGRGGPVTEREAWRLSQRYGDLRGYWAHYLRVGA